jgi:hypothetical protein
MEDHRGAGRLCPFPGPSDGLRREVHGIDGASPASQVDRVPAVPAAEFEDTPGAEQAAAEPLVQVLVRPFLEERDGLGAVCEELVPPAAVDTLQDGVGSAQLTVAGVIDLVWHLLSPSGSGAGAVPGAVFEITGYPTSRDWRANPLVTIDKSARAPARRTRVGCSAEISVQIQP